MTADHDADLHAILAQVSAADTEQLDRWFLQVFKAESVEALLQ